MDFATAVSGPGFQCVRCGPPLGVDRIGPKGKPMAHVTPTLSEQDVLKHARDGLRRRLPLVAARYERTTDDLLNVLLGVVAN
jgi:hypothetical protein